APTRSGAIPHPIPPCERRRTMGYALIWLEGASALLLAGALLVTWTARPRWRWLQVALTFGAALLLLLPPAAVTLLTLGLPVSRDLGLPTDWFFYALSFLVVSLVGVLLVCRAGLSRRQDPVPAARAWPRGRLVLFLAAALILWALT